MTEDALLAEILDMCSRLGLVVFHSTDPRRDIGRGFPDLVIIGERDMCFAELKSGSGRLSPEQTVWRYKIIAAEVAHYVWRPGDLESGRIETILRTL